MLVLVFLKISDLRLRAFVSAQPTGYIYFLFCHFFCGKKVTKKATRNQYTTRFREGALIELSYYCNFSFTSLLLSHFSVARTITILFER
jgi:hypothetical protein